MPCTSGVFDVAFRLPQTSSKAVFWRSEASFAATALEAVLAAAQRPPSNEDSLIRAVGRRLRRSFVTYCAACEWKVTRPKARTARGNGGEEPVLVHPAPIEQSGMGSRGHTGVRCCAFPRLPLKAVQRAAPPTTAQCSSSKPFFRGFLGAHRSAVAKTRSGSNSRTSGPPKRTDQSALSGRSAWRPDVGGGVQTRAVPGSFS